MRGLVLATLFSGAMVHGQTGQLVCKNLTTARTIERIIVDGVLDEPSWSTAAIATDFVQNEPRPNEPSRSRSEVRVLHSDRAIHIGATLHDTPDSVMMRLSGRDEDVLTDQFSVTIDPWRSGRNGFQFTVTAAGVQIDAIVANEEEDVNWHAVWYSATRSTDQGWVAEISIPYSAFRFPIVKDAIWGLQFMRLVGRTREKSFWNPVDPLQDGWLRQCGTLSGISGIDPPMRLMLLPYTSVYAQHSPMDGSDRKEWTSTVNGGMDVKLGLSDAYTLDMTLIPDFGQVVSDNVVLNLSPFEVQYNENRQFFTEGTELFQRGDVFYSRRIGGEPLLRDDLYDGLDAGDEVTEDPAVSKLMNATKVSGRGASGLGIGVLNALTRATFATITDSLGNTRQVLTDPLTNYNVTVVDQQLPNNGYVSLINTNVLREGSTYDANTTAVDVLLNNKLRTVQGAVVGRISRKLGPVLDRRPGYSYEMRLSKTGGALTYGAAFKEFSPEYDPNDLGFWPWVNQRSVEPELEYVKYRPKAPWQRWSIGFNGEYERVIQPDHFGNLAMEVNTFWKHQNFSAFGATIRVEPIRTYDQFEARTPGRLYALPTNVLYEAWVSSDYNRPYALDLFFGHRRFDDLNRRNSLVELEQRFRSTDKLFFILRTSHEDKRDDVGWVATADEGIILGRRDQWTSEIGLEGSYTFTNELSLNVDLRHYWSRAHYVGYHALLPDGELAATGYTGLFEDGSSSHDVDFDAFTVDLWLRWTFAPGSEITMGWKDNIFASEDEVDRNYFHNLRNTWSEPGINSLSIKAIWFLDAGSLLTRNKP